MIVGLVLCAGYGSTNPQRRPNHIKKIFSKGLKKRNGVLSFAVRGPSGPLLSSSLSLPFHFKFKLTAQL